VTNRIYVANTSSDSVTVIDGSTNTTTTAAAGTQPCAVAVNPVTNRIYVVNGRSDNVTVIDGSTNGTTTVAAGTNPWAVAVNPVTNTIYVANFTSNNVTIIDGSTNGTTTVAAGTQPLAVAVNPVTNRIYVVDKGSNDVMVIDNTPPSTSVRTLIDSLLNNTTTLARPALTGNSVNLWTPGRTRIEGVLFGLNSEQKSWNWAKITSGTGTDSVSWSANWGNDSLVNGENFVLAVALESGAATTNSLGLGTPMAGNLTVFPIYRIDGQSTGVLDKTLQHSSRGFTIRATPFGSFVVARGHEKELFRVYSVSGCLVGIYKGEKIGEGLPAGVHCLKQAYGNLYPARFVSGRKSPYQ